MEISDWVRSSHFIHLIHSILARVYQMESELLSYKTSPTQPCPHSPPTPLLLSTQLFICLPMDHHVDVLFHPVCYKASMSGYQFFKEAAEVGQIANKIKRLTDIIYDRGLLGFILFRCPSYILQMPFMHSFRF